MLMPSEESKATPPNPSPPMSQPPPSYSPPMPAPVPMAPIAQPVHMQPPQQATKSAAPKTPAQIGEEYRAALFAQCAQGIHQPKTSYGHGHEQKCDRCGVKLD
ncbi:hypothetical protein CPB85DRAFT_1269775 [Mucidula mucida]|nr:hypothetical protein CPB85DRAFT_1269775 [Mucidula mucida]